MNRADARARVDRGQDEQGLEHDGEVVPVAHQPLRAAGMSREDLGHAHGQRRAAARRVPPRRVSPTSEPGHASDPSRDREHPGCIFEASASEIGRARLVFMREVVTPGTMVHAATSAITRHEALHQHRPVSDQPAHLGSRCRSSSASCREQISAWKPEIAPQAIVMNTNGKSVPGTIGPAPAREPPLSAGILISGRTTRPSRRPGAR